MDSNFTPEVYNFGTVAIGKTADITYTRQGGPKIGRVEPQCGCTGANWSNDGLFLRVTYNAPGSWPEGIQGDEMIVEKHLTVHFTDGNTQTLKLTGKVIR